MAGKLCAQLNTHMTTIKISDLDIVYLSYDEPNCEQHWQHLVAQCPRAQRVHGIKGSDRAHKACAEIAQTERFVTIDGDNLVRADFFTAEVASELITEHSVLSFAGCNAVNGLTYGNGGIKIWPRTVAMNMQTHEASPGGDAAVDFCWALDYILMPGVWSDVMINATRQQAWRAGFREGVKLALINGHHQPDAGQWQRTMAKNNWDRLATWLQVGSDCDNGLWAILGARQGLYRTQLTDWPWQQVQDFDHLDWLWERDLESLDDPGPLINSLGQSLAQQLNLPIAGEPLTAAQSQWFKTLNTLPPRTVARRLR